MLALLRAPSPRLDACELTHVARAPIDFARAQWQHANYADALRELGARIEYLVPLPEHADGAFVEDIAVLLREITIVARPGAESRRPEIASALPALTRLGRPVARIETGTLDGGDVLAIGHTLFVGSAGRTDAAGIARLREIVAPHGYDVRPVATRGCLHLKTAITFIAPDTIVVNPAWVDTEAFGRRRVITVDPGEPFAANTLTLGGATLVSGAFPRTAERLRSAGVATRSLDISELQKAEAGLTCLSLVTSGRSSAG